MGRRPRHQAVRARFPKESYAEDRHHHKVVDIERWLKGKAERASVISAYATHVTDFVAADGSNNIAVTADVHDMAGAQAMMVSPSPADADAAAMERHGVIPPLTVYVEK